MNMKRDSRSNQNHLSRLEKYSHSRVKRNAQKQKANLCTWWLSFFEKITISVCSGIIIKLVLMH